MSTGGNLDIFQILLEASIVVKLDLALLVLASVVGWGIIFRKKLQFNKINKVNEDFYNIFEDSSSLKDIYVSSRDVGDSQFKTLFETGYEEFQKIRDANNGDLIKVHGHFKDFGMESLERAMKSGLAYEEEKMNESLTTLASIGSVTPFVGLFGTVWGIIDAFAGLAQGGATLETVAPGIAEALVATAIGLVAAIPAVWYFNKFNAMKGYASESMISFGEKFINEVQRLLTVKTMER